jgi:hypothetical protein
MANNIRLSLSPYYLNTRRLELLTHAGIPSVAQVSIGNNSGDRAAAMTFASDVAERVLARGRFPILTRELIDNVGDSDFILAQVWDVLTFKGVSASVEADRQGRHQPGQVSATITLGGETYTLSGELLPDHHYSDTTRSELSGRKRMLLAGRFAIERNHIAVSPYIIGDLLDDTEGGGERWGWTISWRSHVRVYPEQIQEFERARGEKRGKAAEVRQLGKVPEEDVKHAFANIIGEPFVPKDWGGERSDLQTNHLRIRNEPSSAAFVFKGPGVSGELHPNRLGRRGDQLIRAFDEPVDLVVVQHHNKIANTVVREAESLASSPSRPRRYCILDGADTVRILKAYGLFPPPPAPKSG